MKFKNTVTNKKISMFKIYKTDNVDQTFYSPLNAKHLNFNIEPLNSWRFFILLVMKYDKQMKLFVFE